MKKTVPTAPQIRSSQIYHPTYLCCRFAVAAARNYLLSSLCGARCCRMLCCLWCCAGAPQRSGAQSPEALKLDDSLVAKPLHVVPSINVPVVQRRSSSSRSESGTPSHVVHAQLRMVGA